MKTAWFALLLAAAALILSFAALGGSRDTYGEVDQAVTKYNELVDSMNEAIAGYNEVGAELNRILAAYESQRLEFNVAVDAYNDVITDYNAQMEWFERLREEVERELGHPL